MSVPLVLDWLDVSNNHISDASFAISFPNTSSEGKQLQVRSNSMSRFVYNTLTGVSFYLTGDPQDVNTVQNVWTIFGGADRPELNGGLEISFDFGRTYIRFDSTHGVEGNPDTYIPLPIEAVGKGGTAQTLGTFDVAHLIARYIVPSEADEYKKLDVRIAVDFDVI